MRIAAAVAAAILIIMSSFYKIHKYKSERIDIDLLSHFLLNDFHLKYAMWCTNVLIRIYTCILERNMAETEKCLNL